MIAVRVPFNGELILMGTSLHSGAETNVIAAGLC